MFRLTQQDVDTICQELWQKRNKITSRVLPHLLHHFPAKCSSDIERTLRNFLDSFAEAFAAGEIDDYCSIESGRLKLEVGVEEEGLGWYYSFGFTEREEDFLYDEVMSLLCRKEW